MSATFQAAPDVIAEINRRYWKILNKAVSLHERYNMPAAAKKELLKIYEGEHTPGISSTQDPLVSRLDQLNLYAMTFMRMTRSVPMDAFLKANVPESSHRDLLSDLEKCSETLCSGKIHLRCCSIGSASLLLGCSSGKIYKLSLDGFHRENLRFPSQLAQDSARPFLGMHIENYNQCFHVKTSTHLYIISNNQILKDISLSSEEAVKWFDRGVVVCAQDAKSITVYTLFGVCMHAAYFEHPIEYLGYMNQHLLVQTAYDYFVFEMHFRE